MTETRIDIQAAPTGVQLTVTIGPHKFNFWRNSGSPEDAVAVSEYVRRGYADATEDVRRLEYLRGWRDKARRVMKSTNWMSSLYRPDWLRKAAGDIK